jgi:hypothetical protein
VVNVTPNSISSERLEWEVDEAFMRIRNIENRGSFGAREVYLIIL